VIRVSLPTLTFALLLACLPIAAQQTAIPDAPSTVLMALSAAPEPATGVAAADSIQVPALADDVNSLIDVDAVAPGAAATGGDSATGGPTSAPQTSSSTQSAPATQTTATPPPATQSKQKAGLFTSDDVDANGNPIPLDRQQPHRLLGFMPNFRTVSAGSKPHPPGWKYNFTVATHQATDYSTFIFLGLTSLFAEGTNAHPSLHKGIGGYYAYTWRGFLDKTDGTYLSAWLLASLLHEDTRFYPLGSGHPIIVRELYIISRQAVTRTYGGRQTPNIAGLGGKVLTQYISRFYYPTGASNFSVLATKFGYSVMRDVIFSNIREFYPDLAAHYLRKHQQRAAARAAADAGTAAPSH
jgi:hypothetical protein